MRGFDDSWYAFKWLALWVSPIAWRGFKRPLEESDLPPTPAPLDDTVTNEDVCVRGARLWAEECRHTSAPSLQRVWLKLSYNSVVAGSCSAWLTGILTTVVRPLVLRQAIRAVKADSEYSLGAGYALIAIFGVVVLLESLSRSLAKFLCGDLAALQCVSATISLLTGKAMDVKVGASKEGAETALVGNDIFRLADMLGFAPNFWTCLSSLGGGIVLLLVFLGPSSLLGVLVMVSCLLISGVLTKKAKKYIAKALGAADGRVGVAREIVEGIKVVKMQLWEEAYLDRIDRCRSEELRFHRWFRMVTVVCIALGRASPMIGATVALDSRHNPTPSTFFNRTPTLLHLSTSPTPPPHTGTSYPAGNIHRLFPLLCARRRRHLSRTIHLPVSPAALHLASRPARAPRKHIRLHEARRATPNPSRPTSEDHSPCSHRCVIIEAAATPPQLQRCVTGLAPEHLHECGEMSERGLRGEDERGAARARPADPGR